MLNKNDFGMNVNIISKPCVYSKALYSANIFSILIGLSLHVLILITIVWIIVNSVFKSFKF